MQIGTKNVFGALEDKFKVNQWLNRVEKKAKLTW